MIQQVYFSKAK